MDDLGRALPGSEGFIDAEQGTKKNQHNEFCLNCGTKLLDTFCHHCGQKDIPKRQTLGELLSNFISSFWSYEGKFFLTTKFLITKPGFLAVEYNAGKRESYYHPARMYVFISFVFFLLFFSLTDSSEDVGKSKNQKSSTSAAALNKTKDKLAKAKVDSILQSNGLDSVSKNIPQSGDTSIVRKNKKNGNIFSLNGVDYTSIKEYDSLEKMKPIAGQDGWLKKLIIYRGIELNDRYKDDENSFSKDFGKAFLENFSKVLFYLLPFFALLLKLLYIRRDYFYSEHLVFTIYYYNFFYLAGSLQLLFNYFPALEWVGTIIGFWILLYLLFAMKRMYNQSWRKTILKYFIFGFLFLIFVGIGFALNALAILMSI